MKSQKILDQERLRDILNTVFKRLAPRLESENYCLVGTAAAMLQGVRLFASDVDFLMRERVHVDDFAEALSSFPAITPPTLLEKARQYYTAYNVNGVPVEASTVEWPTESGYIETLGDGPWKYRKLVEMGVYRVSIINMELRLATELMRNRPDRYNPIITWIKQNGCNAELLKNAVDARNIPDELRKDLDAQMKC